MRRRYYRRRSFIARSEQPFFSSMNGTVQPKEEQPAFFQNKRNDKSSLTIGQPGDKYEQEADAMADHVVRRMSQPGYALVHDAGPGLQRKCSECEEESLSAKLQMQSEEEEVQLQPEEEEEIQTKADEEEEVQMKPEEEEVQMQSEEEEKVQMQSEEEEEVQMQSEDEDKIDTRRIQKSSVKNYSTASLQRRLNQQGGKGFSMPTVTRAQMQQAFGVDFSKVRIHTDQNSVQMNRELGAQAFTHGYDIYFNRNKFNTGSDKGQHLLAHELTHVVQQKGGARKIQRRLRVAGGYPDYLRNKPGNIAQQDPAFSLTPAQRFSFVNGLVQKICPTFQVSSGNGEVQQQGTPRGAAEISGGNNPAGCCCLFVLTRPGSSTDWRILISGTVSPHTFSAKQAALEGFNLPAADQHNSVVIPSPNAEVEYGHFTAADQRHVMEAEIILSHELCGHASLMELAAHPAQANRLEENEHDPTVNIQNRIALEQGAQPADLRGLAAGNQHRGESFAKVIARGYPINRISVFSLPANERAKLDLVARLVKTSNFFVDIVGHTDPSGTQAINDQISRQRALLAKNYLLSKGISRKRHLDHNDNSSPLVDRFTDLRGVRDSFPPTANLGANPDNWRRVEVFLAKFPAGTTNPPAQTPTTVNLVPVPGGATRLAVSGDLCEKLLVKTAWGGRVP